MPVPQVTFPAAAAYSRGWRTVTALLAVAGHAGALGMVIALCFFETRLDNPLRLLRTYVVASFAPALAAWLLGRAFTASAAIEQARFVVTRRDERIEVPCDAIARVDPWVLPGVGPGVSIGLRSGRRFPVAVATTDPIAMGDALADAGAAPAVRDAARRPMAVYGRTWGAPRRALHLLFQFPLLALVPTLPVFRLHQWIAFGGTFGEYYAYGLQAYLLAFAIQWWTFTINFVLWAAVLRTLAELAVLAAAWLAPERAMAVRRLAERAYWTLYVGALPAFLIRLAVLAA